MTLTLGLDFLSITVQHWAQILVLVVMLAGCIYALKADFKKSFLLIPLLIYLQRFNLTVTFFEFEKTIQIIYPIIPILFWKARNAYRQTFTNKKLHREPYVILALVLLTTDITTSLISPVPLTSIVHSLPRLLTWMIFITGSIWWQVLVQSSHLQKYLLRLVGILAAVAALNIFISWHQFADCTVWHNECVFWQDMDTEYMPNHLMPVGAQKLSWQFDVIKLPGYFGDINFNGWFLVMYGSLFFILGIFGLQKQKRSLKRAAILSLGLWILAIVTYVLVQSRSALLGLGFVYLPLSILLINKTVNFRPLINKYRRHIVAFGLIILAGLVGGTLLASTLSFNYNNQEKTLLKLMKEDTLERFVNVGENDSAKLRVQYWQDSLVLAKSNSFMPYGIGEYKDAYSNEIGPVANIDPHSTYLKLLVEQGLLGLLSYASVFIVICYYAIRYIRQALRRSQTKRQPYSYLLISSWAVMALPFLFIITIFYYGFSLPMFWWLGMISQQEVAND